MKRAKYKKKAQSRDCSCIKGKNRDSNFNEVIDEICDKYEKKIKKLKTGLKIVGEIHRELMQDQARKHNIKIALMMEQYPGCLG